jgi:hypothetical protein
MEDTRIPGLPAKPQGVPIASGWLFAAWSPDDDETYKVDYSDLQLAALASDVFPSKANAFANGQPPYANMEAAVVWMLQNWMLSTGQLAIGSAPSVALSANPQTLQAGQDVEFTVLAVPTSGVNVAKVQIKNGNQVLYEFPANATSFKWVWKSVAQGNYSIQAVVTDSDNKVGKSNVIALPVTSATAPPPATTDTTNPNISFTIPAAGATLTPGTQIMLTASATDNVGVAGVLFTDGATGVVIGPGAKNGNVYTFPYTVGAAGPLSLVATATDAAGNAQTATVNVTVSSGTIVQPVAPDFYGFDDVNNTVSVSHPTLPVSELLYDFNGATGLSVPNNNVISVGNLAGQVTAYARASGTRPEGARRNSQPFTIAQSATAPTVTLASPQSGQTVVIGQPLVLNATPTAGSNPVVKVEFLEDGVKFTETTVAPHTIQRNMTTAGAHVYTSRAIDSVGSFGLSNPISISGSTGNTVPASNDYAMVAVGDSTATNDYSPFEPTLTRILNTALSNNARPGAFTNHLSTAISGQALIANPDGSPGGLIGNFASQMGGRYVQGKYNVNFVQCLLNSLAGEVYLRGEAGAAERVYAQLKQYIALVRADNANWCIIVGTLTRRTNGVQPGQENQRGILNQMIVDGKASGDLDVQAVALFGFDTRLSSPGPNNDGSATAWFLDWVHYTQQTLDAVVCPSYRDAFLFARFGIPQPAPYTGVAASGLYLANAQVLPVKTKSVGVAETAVNSGIYTVPNGGSYGDWSRSILFAASMPATGKSRVLFKKAAIDSLNAIVGLSTTNTLATLTTAYEAYNIWVYQHEDGRILGRTGPAGGEGMDLGGRMGLNEYLSIDKDGSTISLSKTTDGVTYDTFYTFPGSYPNALYINVNLEASLGKIYAPQGFGLTLAANPVVATYSADITFTDNIDQVNTAGVITAPNHGNGAWGAIGLCTTHNAKVGTRIITDFSPSAVGFAIIGFSNVRAKVGYASGDFSAGIWLVNYQGVSYVHKITSGTDTLLTSYAPDARIWSMLLTPAGVSVEYSLNNGGTWVVAGSIPYAYGDVAYIVSDINQGGALLHPRGTELILN